jgi:hypothetical protein
VPVHHALGHSLFRLKPQATNNQEVDRASKGRETTSFFSMSGTLAFTSGYHSAPSIAVDASVGPMVTRSINSTDQPEGPVGHVLNFTD